MLVRSLERLTALRLEVAAVAAVVACFAVAIFSSGSASAAPASCNATDLYVGKAAPDGTPKACTFRSITDAIEDAQGRGLGDGARIILTGSTVTRPVVFRNETFPLTVPAGVTLTTSDDLTLGGAGLNPANYVVPLAESVPHAVELGGGLKGVTLQNERGGDATTMLICVSGSATIDAVTLDGTSSAGSVITEGLRLEPGCDLDATTLRVRRFGGDGVTVVQGADLTLDESKVHDNGGDGIVIRGLSSVSTSEIAFNGDDGVLVDSSGGSAFNDNVVRDNGGNGFEVRTSDVSFLSNQIYSNSRGTGWDEPQMLFVGPAPLGTGVQFWTGSMWVTAYAVGIPDGDCSDDAVLNAVNQIHSYNTSDSAEGTVGIYAASGADIWADNNSWRAAVESENVDQDANSSVAANVICPAGGILLQMAPYPGPPVE